MSVSRTLVNTASQCEEPRKRQETAEQCNTCQVEMKDCTKGNVLLVTKAIEWSSIDGVLMRFYCKISSFEGTPVKRVLGRPPTQVSLKNVKPLCFHYS